MFASRFFAPRHFASRYFAPGGDVVVEAPGAEVNSTGDEVMRRRPHWSGRMYADDVMEAWGRRLNASVDIDMDGAEVRLRSGVRAADPSPRRGRKRLRRIAAAHRMSLAKAEEVAASLALADAALEVERAKAILDEDDLIEILLLADEI